MTRPKTRRKANEPANSDGFAAIPRWLRGKLTAHEIAVYIALAWRLNEEGSAFPSLATIAKDAGMGRSTAHRVLLRLRDLGLVDWETRTIDGGVKTSNIYRLTFTRPTDGPMSQNGTSSQNGTGVVPERDWGSPAAGQEVEPLKYNQGSTSTSETPPAISDPAQVELESQDDQTEPRPEVVALCEHLADRIEANGSKRPTITRKWLDAARLLLDRDQRTPDQVHRAIDWCQDDEFWRSNILSMPKLREQYDRLRLAAQRDQTPAGRQQVDWDAAMAQAQAATAALEAQPETFPAHAMTLASQRALGARV